MTWISHFFQCHCTLVFLAMYLEFLYPRPDSSTPLGLWAPKIWFLHILLTHFYTLQEISKY
jgi:hypothetical protein